MLIYIAYAASLSNETKFDLLYVIGQLLEVYHQERNITKYLYQDGLPALTEMSLCFWMKLEVDDDNRTDDWLLSIALPGTFYIYAYINTCICILTVSTITFAAY